MITWSEVKPEFDWDGSLRDIYILATTVNDWRAIYTVLKQFPHTELILDGKLAPLYLTLSGISVRRSSLRMLTSGTSWQRARVDVGIFATQMMG